VRKGPGREGNCVTLDVTAGWWSKRKHRNKGPVPNLATKAKGWPESIVGAGMVLLCLSYLNCFGPRAGAETSGQQSLKNLSLEELGRVEVTTVAKEPEQVWKTSAAIYVITQDDIERSGATSLPEVLRLAPGVEVARISGNKWSIGIRGFGSRLSRDVLVLIDGRAVYTTLLAGTYWEVQNVVLDDVERIEVIRGPGGQSGGPTRSMV
jgi:iron complex outermembrane recepter protein